jgi:glycosyltransferase involved in cell wall biosynthesis
MARLLFISHTAEISGPTYRLVALLKRLRQDHELAVAAPRPGPLFDALEPLGVAAIIPEHYGLTRRSLPWLCRLILREKFDLLYGNNYSSEARNALLAAKLTGRPFIWHINEMLKPGRAAHWRKVIFLRLADALIADSQACARSVAYHVPGRTVHQIYNGIELGEYDFDRQSARRYVTEALGIPADHQVVIHAGIVCARKGQAFGVQAAIHLLQLRIGDDPRVIPNLSFVFLGDLETEPAYVQSLRQAISQAGLEGSILLPGFRDDFNILLAGGDVFLHTALRDPHPLVVLSAMAARLPVVAFGVDGVVEEVADGETGYLAPSGDVDALVKALAACLGDPTLRQRMGAAARRRVESLFSADETARKIGQVIDSTLREERLMGRDNWG